MIFSDTDLENEFQVIELALNNWNGVSCLARDERCQMAVEQPPT